MSDTRSRASPLAPRRPNAPRPSSAGAILTKQTDPLLPDQPRRPLQSAAGHPPYMQALLHFSERFGNMLSRIFLTLLYYLLLGPFALVYRLFADPLRIARPRSGNWAAWVARNETLEAAHKQD